MRENLFEAHPYVTTITYALGSALLIEKKKIEAKLTSIIRSYHYTIANFYNLEDDSQTMKAISPKADVSSDAMKAFDCIGNKISLEVSSTIKKNILSGKNF